MSAKELYWHQIYTNELTSPWKRKWENALPNTEIEWEKMWNNVHCNMLQFKVQSKLWEFTNLNFISSFTLHRMYNTDNVCKQCGQEEESSTHIFLTCNMSLCLYTKFEPLLKKIHNINLSQEEMALGIKIENKNTQKRERLRNYVFATIKYTLFKDRVQTQNTIFQRVTALYNKIRSFISTDLQLKFLFAKKNKNIASFKENFLIQDILAIYSEDEQTIKINF